MKEVIINVTGGVARIHSLPPGIVVKIVDFDIEGAEDWELGQFEGKECFLTEHETKKEVKK